jgi:predicted Zn-dependent protease
MDSAEWKTLLDEEPDNELVRFSYAKALMDEKSWPLAIREFERLVAADADYAIAWAFLARCALNAGERDKARAAAERGMPAARKLGHDVPIEELESVLEELDSEF